MSKSEANTNSLWEAQTRTAKIDYFTKNISPPRFFEINTSNFQEISLDIFLKICQKGILKKLIKKNYKKNKQKKQFFLVFLL